MALLDFFDKRKKDPNAEMSFIDHLEELRWHLIRSVIAILVGAIVVFILCQGGCRSGYFCSDPFGFYYCEMALQPWSNNWHRRCTLLFAGESRIS